MIEVGAVGVPPRWSTMQMVQVPLHLHRDEMAVSVMEGRFQFNSPGPVNTLVGHRTGDLLLVEPLEL